MILAQLESTLTDFLAQMPPIVYLMFCGSSILLVVALIVIANARGRKARDLRAQVEAASALSISPRGASGEGEMPDLDLLVSGAPARRTPPPAARRGTYTLTLANGRQVEAAEVMIVARDLADGSLIVQIGERAYASGTEIDDPEARRRFETTLRELVRLLGQSAPPAAAPAPAPASPPAQVTPPPAPPAPPRPAPPVRPGGAPFDLPKFNTDQPTPATRRELKKAIEQPIPEINIADAIEAYLQHKLGFTPQFNGRRIHVYPAPGGGVSIEVDGRFYEAVGDVEDTEVREFLAQTIQEWQDRQ